MKKIITIALVFFFMIDTKLDAQDICSMLQITGLTTVSITGLLFFGAGTVQCCIERYDPYTTTNDAESALLIEQYKRTKGYYKPIMVALACSGLTFFVTGAQFIIYKVICS